MSNRLRSPRAGEIWTPVKSVKIPSRRVEVISLEPGDPILIIDVLENWMRSTAVLRILVKGETHDVYVSLLDIMNMEDYRVQNQSPQTEGHHSQADRDFPSTPWI